ncbi:SURF1 family cytochrome oxidase biogenesis protein [Streptomyces sp. LE64]|uniref:SURF1 family cytochrome oxidase biogenesis protein n=1 Tax=unclassified Streptomyces TaxID=2593676 RepID=UPI00332095A0
MYRFLLSRQWVILTLLALALIPTMIELGFWQFHRHENRIAHNQRIEAAITAAPVPVAELTSPGRTVSDEERYRRVTAEGTYDTEHQYVVRRRTNADDQIGVHVLTPLVLDDGTALLVNRGWIASNGPQTRLPRIPEPPSGEVTVTGRLMPDETTAKSGIKDLKGLPEGMVMLINGAALAEDIGRPVLGGFIELSAPEPSGGTPQLLSSPDHSGIGAHMAYAVQWWLFTAAVPVGWVILVRRELRDRAAARAQEQQAAEQPPATAGV